jgi:hypothetical protein
LAEIPEGRGERLLLTAEDALEVVALAAGALGEASLGVGGEGVGLGLEGGPEREEEGGGVGPDARGDGLVRAARALREEALDRLDGAAGGGAVFVGAHVEGIGAALPRGGDRDDLIV